MPAARQLSASLANKPGTLAELTGALGREGINIQALMVFEGRARFLVNDPVKAREAVRKLGLQVFEDEVLALEIESRAGALGRATKRIADAGVNIDYCYTGGARSEGKLLGVFAVSDLKKALKAVGDST
jgi:hypothetical protein